MIPATATGATVVCKVAATNDGGTTLEETDPTPVVKPAPQVKILKVAALAGIRGRALELRVSLQSPPGLWGKFAVCLTPPKPVAGRLCRSLTNSDGESGIFPFTFKFRIKPTAPIGKSTISISAVAGPSQASAATPLMISKS